MENENTISEITSKSSNSGDSANIEAGHYAVMKAKGKQFTVSAGTVLVIDRIAVEVGQEISFDDVLLIGDSSDANSPRLVGAPFVAGASVRATVVRHLRGKKLIIFKKRQRSRYTLKKGHRQEQTEVRIERIAV